MLNPIKNRDNDNCIIAPVVCRAVVIIGMAGKYNVLPPLPNAIALITNIEASKLFFLGIIKNTLNDYVVPINPFYLIMNFMLLVLTCYIDSSYQNAQRSHHSIGIARYSSLQIILCTRECLNEMAVRDGLFVPIGLIHLY